MKAFIFLGIVAFFAFFAFVPPQPMRAPQAHAEEIVTVEAMDPWLR